MTAAKDSWAYFYHPPDPYNPMSENIKNKYFHTEQFFGHTCFEESYINGFEKMSTFQSHQLTQPNHRATDQQIEQLAVGC